MRVIAEAMVERPGHSISRLFGGSYAMNAAYDFFKQQHATPDNIQKGHRALTRERCSAPGLYLFAEDTSEISYSGREPVRGLATVGPDHSEKVQGFLLHSVLAVKVPAQGLADGGRRHGPLEVMGLVHQQFALRQRRPKAEKAKGGTVRKSVTRRFESDLWPDSVAATGPPPALPGVRWVRVSDRAADFYEYFAALADGGWGFVVRAMQDRRLQDPLTGERCGHLLAQLRARPALGTFGIDLRARPGAPARHAELSVASLEGALIQSPQRPGKAQGSLPPVPVNAVRVWEARSTAKRPLEWLLVTSQPAGTFEEARQASLMYACRWTVEEFHKALKSGMGAERLQLEEGRRLFAAVAVMSIVALRLLDIRDRSRLIPQAPASEAGFDETDTMILRTRTRLPVATVRDAVRAVARLGGFLGRTADGEPGMLTLWRGLAELRLMRQGYEIARASPP